jgi:hypothetical protein
VFVEKEERPYRISLHLRPFANDVSLQFIWEISKIKLDKCTPMLTKSVDRQLPCLLHILLYLLGGLSKVASFGSGVAMGYYPYYRHTFFCK